MKTTTFTLLLLLSCFQWLAGQCPTGDITFSTQGQIDSFQINYPGCTQIFGYLSIKESVSGSITNLDSLSQINSVGEGLSVSNNAALTSLSGLDNLTSVGGDLSVSSNAALTSLSGLDSLTAIGGYSYVGNNPALTSLSGLDNLTSIGGGLSVSSNAALTSLSGLENLTSVGDLSVSSNAALTSLNGLENLQTIGGSLIVSQNPALVNLNGLDKLASIGANLIIVRNDSLTNISALWQLDTIPGSIRIGSFVGGGPGGNPQGNASLVNLDGLGNIRGIGGDFYIMRNSLVNLNGLENLRTIGGSFFIYHSLALASLNGLENLQTIGGDFEIGPNYGTYNDQTSLISLSGLENLQSIGGYLQIIGNPILSICGTPPICAYLENGGSAYFSYNAPGCNSVPEVEAACQVSPTKEAEKWGNEAIQIIPNPATNFINLHFPKPFYESLQVSLFDSQGRSVGQQAATDGQAMEVGHLPSGMYTLEVVAGERVFVGKFIKQ